MKRIGLAAMVWLLALGLAAWASSAVSTTTVQGTVYLANGQAGTGTLVISWPAFTTASGQAVAAGSTSMQIAADGFVSVNLAPNEGATPSGEYYTAVYHMSDGTTSTEYWVVPSGTQATLGSVRAQVMPAAQAVKAVSKGYVDQAIAELTESLLTASGGTLSGPLTLSGDPTQPMQAATKHYVDTQVAAVAPPANTVGAIFPVDQLSGADFGAKLQACVNAINSTYGGTCDARNFSGNLSMASNLTIAKSNTAVLLPCATITTANSIVIPAGTRNVSLRGCSLRGGTQASGSQGGSVFAYTGTDAMVKVGDATYASDTPGFHMDNVAINTTAASSGAQGLVAYRTQEMNLASLYFLGNADQTGMTLDGTGDYTGGTFQDNQFNGFGTAVNAIGHQVANAATTDWLNASTFIRLHIVCPTSNGSPISGTYGINLQQGDGNTFTGGDVEGCSTALHLGPNAQNNTIDGLRNENSTSQIVADAGSANNSWMTGGTMFTGKLIDNGSRNSFLDSFHRSFNALNGDQWHSQADTTVTNHIYTGIGLGNVRGRVDEYVTDVPGVAGSYQNAWQWGPGDGTTGQQIWNLTDLLNNVQRFGVQQNTTAGGNLQSYLNAAGTGNVCFNCSTNSGTGGVSFASGGATPATVATIDNAGNTHFTGALQVDGKSQSAGTMTVRNNADAEVDYYLRPGLTTSQKGSFTYIDWDGKSQWYMVKDANNNWALNSATGGLDSFKAYQSSNSGDTYINASNASGHIRLNYESGAGAETDIYSGSNSSLIAAFASPTAIKLPGLAATTGHNCLQIDNSGYISNTGSACGTGSGGTSGTVDSAAAGAIAYYAANGTTIDGISTVPVTAGGTGASTASGALANLLPGAASDGSNGLTVTGNVSATTIVPKISPQADIRAYGAKCDGTSDDTAAFQAAITALGSGGGEILVPGLGSGCYLANPTTLSWTGIGPTAVHIQGTLKLGSTLPSPDYVDWIGDGGASGSMFHGSGPVAEIQGPTATGTLGTACTAGTSCTFTPSTMNGIATGAAVSVYGNTSCTITSITRASNVVTATLGGACHIAPDFTVTVSGVTDTSFNGSFTVANADYVQNTLGWPQTGSNTTSSGGTASGPNEDSIETAPITATTASTATASFVQAHSASDTWGLAGIYLKGWTHHELRGISASASGEAIWAYQAAMIHLDGVSVEAFAPNQGVEFNESFWNFITDSAFLINYGSASWAMRLTNTNLSSGSNAGYISVRDSVVSGGIKIDRGAENLFLQNHVSEATSRGAVVIDPSVNPVVGTISFDTAELQDNFNGAQQCLINSLYPTSTGTVLVKGLSGYGCIANKYYHGNKQISGANASTVIDTNGTEWGGTETATDGVNISQGATTETELRGEGASMGPSLIPFATQPVTQTTSWSGNAYCSVTQGALSPTGAADAISLTGTSSANPLSFYSYSTTPAVGDWILFGGWVFSPATGQAPASAMGGAFTLNTMSATGIALSESQDQSGNSYVNTHELAIGSDWWHPTVAAAVVKAADGNSHTVTLQAACPNPGSSVNYYKPFMIYIPASAHVPVREIARWKQQLLHGIVPPGISAGALGIDPALKFAWGSDTNLYRGSAGVIQTDGAINAATGYKVNGSALAAAHLSNGTTGSGSVVLATSPTLTTPVLGAASATSITTSAASTLGGNTNLFNNAAAANNVVAIQAGTTAAQTETLQWQNYSGTAEWQNSVDTSYTYHVKDAVNSLDRMTAYQGGNTNINAGSGAHAVCLNCAANSGTSGLLVQNGAASPATVLTVTGSGNTTATGFISGKSFMGTGTMTLATGAAAGTGPSIACATNHVCDSVSGTVTLTTGTSPATGTLATLTFPSSHTNYGNCMVTTLSSTAQVTTNTWTESATAITITANTAPAASTAYTVRYWCGGN